MAGDWIKFEHSTTDKPEVVTMAADLNIDQDAVVGKLLRVWIWTDQQSQDGCGISVTTSFLDRLVFCNGFASAMRKVGWIEGHDSALTFPNFARHNGQTSKLRAESARRMKKSRGNRCDNVADKAQPKAQPEKRREENIKKEREGLESKHRRPTLAQAKSAAADIGITESKAEEWWNCREASEWMKGMAGGSTSPVGSNWQADLTTYAKRGGYSAGSGNSHREEKQAKEFPEQMKIKHL